MLSLAALPFLLFLSACFAGSEAALFTLAAEGGAPTCTRRLLRHPSRTLSVLLLGNLLANLAWFSTSAAAAANLAPAQQAAAALATVLALVVAGEIVPKALARRYPARSALWMTLPLRVLDRLVGPFAGPTRTPEGGRAKPLAASEVESLMTEVGGGMLPPLDQELVLRILQVGGLRAGAARIPLGDVLRVQESTPFGLARQRLREQRLSWALVANDHGEFVGVLDLVRHQKGEQVGGIMGPIPILPEVAPLSRAAVLLRETGSPVVLLVDEFGEAAGVLARGRWADTLLSRLVADGRIPAAQRLSPNRWRLDPALPLHVFRQRFADPGPVDPKLDTVGGLLAERLGRIPQEGDTLPLVAAGFRWEIQVEEALPEGPTRLLLTKHSAGEEVL